MGDAHGMMRPRLRWLNRRRLLPSNHRPTPQRGPPRRSRAEVPRS
jgi:hypothetical protein